MKKLFSNLFELPKINCVKFFIILFGAFFISTKLTGAFPFNYIHNFTGIIIILFCPGIFIYDLIPKQYLSSYFIEKIVFSIGLSIIIQPAVIYFLNVIFGFPITFNMLVFINLLYFFVFFVLKSVQKDKQNINIEISREDNTIIIGYLTICLIHILYSFSYPYLLAGDPYTFKNITDYILSTGIYPQGFEPFTYLAPYWNYEPLYQLYLALMSIFSGLDTFFVYKYISIFLVNLSILPLYLVLKKIIPYKFNVTSAIVLIVSFVSIPILFLEIETPRPQTFIFLFLPIIIYLLILSIKNRAYLFAALVTTIFISKFHLFYVLFLPAIFFVAISSNWKKMISNKIASLKYLFLLAIIVFPYLIIFRISDRLRWLKSIFDGYPTGLTFDKTFLPLDYLYNLGVFSIVLTALFFYGLFKENDFFTRKKMLILAIFLAEFFILIGIFPAINWGFISDRFFPLLGIILIITSNFGYYVLTENERNLTYKKVAVLSTLILSLLITFHVNSQNSGEWMTEKEVASIKKISPKIDNDGIIITQGNNVPLIRQALGKGYLYILSETEKNEIFFGNNEDAKINSLNSICTFDIREKDKVLSDIERQYGNILENIIYKDKDYNEDEINSQIINQVERENELMKYNVNFVPLNKDGMIRYLIERKLDILKNKISLNNLLSRNLNLTKKSLYIIYSLDKKNTSHKNENWWKEFGYQNADLTFFDKNKDYFENMSLDENIKVWKFKKCDIQHNN